MGNKVAVSKVILEVGGKKIELSLQEAQELKMVLIDTFPEKEIQYMPPTPIYVEQWRRPYWDQYKVGSGTTTKCAISLCAKTEDNKWEG